MKESRVAIRYAKALLNQAKEKNQLEAVNSDMALVAGTCKSSKDLQMMLKSPIVKADVKEKALGAIFAGQIGEISLSFLTLLTEKGREYLLAEVSDAFADLYRAENGIVKILITSATSLSASQVEKISASVNVKANKLEVEQIINPDLIGGFVVRVGDKQFDGSVKRSLTDIKRIFN